MNEDAPPPTAIDKAGVKGEARGIEGEDGRAEVELGFGSKRARVRARLLRMERC